jgi:hypothetical protein
MATWSNIVKAGAPCCRHGPLPAWHVQVIRQVSKGLACPGGLVNSKCVDRNPSPDKGRAVGGPAYTSAYAGQAFHTSISMQAISLVQAITPDAQQHMRCWHIPHNTDGSRQQAAAMTVRRSDHLALRAHHYAGAARTRSKLASATPPKRPSKCLETL